MIISVSRRTDIPAFYSEWFMDKIKKGKCVYYNPYNKKGFEVSLVPKDVDVFVFWSKNYKPLMPYIQKLKYKYNLFFFYTITGTHGILERNVININKAISNFKELVEIFGSKQVRWRFDPILLTNKTNEKYYIDKFQYISDELENYATHCYISYANIYSKVQKNLLKNPNIVSLERSTKDKQNLARQIANIANQKGIDVYSCCNDFLVDEYIKKASCIDANYFSKIYDLNLKLSKSPSRKQCNCYKSIDIGVYNTCPHGCLYCYANYDYEEAKKNYHLNDPKDNFLGNFRLKEIKVLDNKTESEQLRLFDKF